MFKQRILRWNRPNRDFTTVSDLYHKELFQKQLLMLHLEAPAQDALEYQIRKFNNGINNTIYQGIPSPEVDKAWTDLYNGMKAMFLFV